MICSSIAQGNAKKAEKKARLHLLLFHAAMNAFDVTTRNATGFDLYHELWNHPEDQVRSSIRISFTNQQSMGAACRRYLGDHRYRDFVLENDNWNHYRGLDEAPANGPQAKHSSLDAALALPADFATNAISFFYLKVTTDCKSISKK